MKDNLILPAVFMAGLIGGFLIGGSVAGHQARKAVRIEAIQHNAAYWDVKSDGTTVFKWNDEKGK